jgi:hypothetical protein
MITILGEPMAKQMLFLIIAVAVLVSCKSKTESAADVAPSGSSTPPTHESTPGAAKPANPTISDAAIPQYGDPPSFEVGMSVDEAYAAIPHRRTVWDDIGTTVPADEKAHLRTMFKLMDHAIVVRVAGLQNFSSQQFEKSDPAAGYGRLIEFARGMPVPSGLTAYHQKILDGLSNQRQFFAEWAAARGHFQFAQQIGDHPAVRNASTSIRAAYNELMSRYPDESQENKNAFFDYHCALDFL